MKHFSSHLFAISLPAVVMMVSCADTKDDKIQKPNVIILFIDDMGYGDIEPFGSVINNTPNLNKMAEEGLCLTSFYAQTVSSPSRAALMTGCYPKRVGLGKGIDNDVVLFPKDSIGINSDEMTLGEVFQEAGYTTGCFGKWHLGDQPEFLPNQHGFDVFEGIPYSNDMWTLSKDKSRNYQPLPWIKDNEVVGTIESMKQQAGLCRRVINATVDFIAENRNRPFFAYVPYTFIHYPRIATEEYMKTANCMWEMPAQKRFIKAQVEEIDWSVGYLMENLRQMKLDKNTIVIFTSDNGGEPTSNNYPFRGFKSLTLEGGVRVPMIAWYPGVIPANTKSDEMASTMDFVPTFANMIGVELSQERVLDGENIWPLLTNPHETKTPHETFFYFNRLEVLEAVRSGKWKLTTSGKLYDIVSDTGEARDIADQNPDVVDTLQEYLNQMAADLGDGSGCRLPGIVEDTEYLKFIPTK